MKREIAYWLTIIALVGTIVAQFTSYSTRLSGIEDDLKEVRYAVMLIMSAR